MNCLNELKKELMQAEDLYALSQTKAKKSILRKRIDKLKNEIAIYANKN